MKDKLLIQQSKLKKGNPKLDLIGPCRIGNGINQLNEKEKLNFINYFNQEFNHYKITFFIPASGSGSRMFESAYKFIQENNPSDEVLEFVEHLINCIQDFAFYNLLSDKTKEELSNGTIDLTEFLKYILNVEGLNFGNSPKGLIPFHQYEKDSTNAFQEHIIQVKEITNENSTFHFTISPLFKNEITKSIELLNANISYEFSIQDPKSDAITFDENFNPIVDSTGNYLLRPAGHGTLISNLNLIESDLIFIRNIDNIQHLSKSTKSILTRKFLGGILLKLKSDIKTILTNSDSSEKIKLANELNKEFDLKIPDQILSNANELVSYLNRPIRVCGMVKNEGQPGGGPFWVKDEKGILTKQIIEKSQIAHEHEQLALLVKSTHFNPVEIVCTTNDVYGNKFDLTKFNNENLYFIVHKTQEGKSIQYIEEPGLWNGQMDNWITLFYEIDGECFSPVKTVLDLLKPAHRK